MQFLEDNYLPHLQTNSSLPSNHTRSTSKNTLNSYQEQKPSVQTHSSNPPRFRPHNRPRNLKICTLSGQGHIRAPGFRRCYRRVKLRPS